MAVLDTAMVKAMMAPNIFRMAIYFLWMSGRPDLPAWMAAYRGLFHRYPAATLT